MAETPAGTAGRRRSARRREGSVERLTIGDAAPSLSGQEPDPPEPDPTEAAASSGSAPTEPAAAGRAASCPYVLCPICMALTALGQARPELTEHVLLASREVLLAVRALIDARLEDAPAGAPRLERLDIG